MTTIFILEAIVPKIMSVRSILTRSGYWIMHLIPPQLVEFRSRSLFFSPPAPAPELSSSDDLFNLFLNLRNASVHFRWSSPNLRHLQERQLHLNLLCRLCEVSGEAQALL